MIARLVRARHPARLVACLDAAWRPAFRVAALPSYKAHRANPDGSEQVPDALTAQIPVILDVLAAAGVAMAGAAGYEADDIIGTLAAARAQPGRGRHRRPRPVPARRRRARRPDRLHRPGPGQPGARRRGGRHREVRDPRPGLCRVRGAARRPERRPARGAWRGGEDRGRAGTRVRLDRGNAGRPWTPGTAASRWAAGPSWSPARPTWTPACRWSGWPPTRRSSSSAASCRRCRPTRPGSPSWTSAGTSARRWAGRCPRSPRHPRLARQRARARAEAPAARPGRCRLPGRCCPAPPARR